VRLSLLTITLAHITVSISYVTVVVRARLAALHPEVEQAAMDLGATEWAAFRKVTLPMIAPGVAAAGFASPVTAPIVTQGIPQPPPAPGSIAQQEVEARMLVSDLLEIGIQQRKAYEEAQKKADQERAAGKKN
jgi:ABC-type phosphate transport system permease subunit